MKVIELLKNVYDPKFDWMEELEVRHYIPVLEKRDFAMDVVAMCTDDIDGCVIVDKFKMNIYFKMQMIALYTNIEVADDYYAMIEQYDALCENSIMDRIISLFASDYCAMENVLADMIHELVAQNSIDMQVVKIANKIKSVIDSISNGVNEIDSDNTFADSDAFKELAEFFALFK